jgi:3-oxoacyl-[acyl-carrier-protein] synthase II
MALSAAKDALIAAGLATRKPLIDGGPTHPSEAEIEINFQGVDPTRVGVFWGSGMAGAYSFDQTAEMLYHQQKRIRPTSVVTIMPNSAAAELALLIKAQGTCMTYSCACASSAVAMGEALRALRAGWLDVALVGGSEAMLSPGVLASWNALRVLSPVKDDARNACRPFAKDRSGFALGEGAGAFILERSGHAAKRGVTSKLELRGYASNCDATHMTLPDAAGQVRAMNAALQDAHLSAKDIGYVNAHATATIAGDAAEVGSVTEILGQDVPISSTKGQFGHMLGAAGALEMIVSLKALEHQTLPPNAHLSTELVDPGFNLNFVGTKGSPQVLKHALSNSFAFGGTNAVLIASLVD